MLKKRFTADIVIITIKELLCIPGRREGAMSPMGRYEGKKESQKKHLSVENQNLLYKRPICALMYTNNDDYVLNYLSSNIKYIS